VIVLESIRTMLLPWDVVEKLERDEEGTAMDGSPTHANSLWLDPRYPPSTTPAKEERWPLFTTPLVPLSTQDSLQDKIWQYRGERPVLRRNLNLSLDITPTEQKHLHVPQCSLYSPQSPHPANGVSFLWQIMPFTTTPIRPRVTRPL
jgi:hypothetical protein